MFDLVLKDLFHLGQLDLFLVYNGRRIRRHLRLAFAAAKPETQQQYYCTDPHSFCLHTLTSRKQRCRSCQLVYPRVRPVNPAHAIGDPMEVRAWLHFGRHHSYYPCRFGKCNTSKHTYIFVWVVGRDGIPPMQIGPTDTLSISPGVASGAHQQHNAGNQDLQRGALSIQRLEGCRCGGRKSLPQCQLLQRVRAMHFELIECRYCGWHDGGS